eukprot:scaffold44518_cov237-Amphora_coffeaeformis.AAC.2
MLGGPQSKHEVNIVSKSKGPGRHTFVQMDTEDRNMRYGVTHHADGNWLLTQNNTSPHKTEYSMNQMIFDFRRYTFNVRREAFWEGIEYVVEISEMIKETEPFYHAATYHQTNSNIYATGKLTLRFWTFPVPVQSSASSQPKDEKTVGMCELNGAAHSSQ